MKRLTSALRLVAIALPALVAIGTGLAQDIDETEKARLIHAAERGNAQAQFELGARYRGGREGFERNSTEAVRWYRRSAEQGFTLAQSYLGIAYALGQSVERDAAEAARWCRLGAEQGDSGGQLCLALLYANGTGVAQDDAEAVRWLRLAGEQGHGVAQARLGDLYASGEDGVRYPFHLLALGDMYRGGIGVPRNYVAAYKWFDIAARWHRSRQLYAPVSGASNTSATAAVKPGSRGEAASPPRAYTPCSA